jgi:hypothetical protein
MMAGNYLYDHCEMEVASDWVGLKEMKATHPIEVVEYAKANRLDHEPAFAWWANDALRTRNRIISKVKSRYWKTTHKFGIELPHSVPEEYSLDKQNGKNLLWMKAIEKEMGKIKSLGAFERFDKGSADDIRTGQIKLPGYQEICCHIMIFDIKMDGRFTRKAPQYVADGSMTLDVPAYNTYACVVSWESVRIAFLYTSLNDLEILACDVTNANLNAPSKEKIWLQGGAEFGSGEGMVFLIPKALYGVNLQVSLGGQS